MKSLLNSKKGFDANQMFIFITAVVVVGFVLLFGTQIIGKFIFATDNVEKLQLVKELKSLIVGVGDHDQKIFDDKLPNGFTSMCFFDITSIRALSEEEKMCPPAVNKTSTRLCDVWDEVSDSNSDAQLKNLVLIASDKTIADPIYVEGIRIENKTSKDATSLCIDTRNFELRLRGSQREVFIKIFNASE